MSRIVGRCVLSGGCGVPPPRTVRIAGLTERVELHPGGEHGAASAPAISGLVTAIICS